MLLANKIHRVPKSTSILHGVPKSTSILDVGHIAKIHGVPKSQVCVVLVLSHSSALHFLFKLITAQVTGGTGHSPVALVIDLASTTG